MMIQGVVVDDQGNPLADVRVRALGPDWSVLASGLTDSSGAFSLSAEGAVSVHAYPPGWDGRAGDVRHLPCLVRIPGTPRPSAASVTIRLPRAAPVPLLIYDHEGQQIRGRTDAARQLLNPVHVVLYDLWERPLPGELHWSDQDDRPTLLVPPGQPFVIRLLWTAPGYGRIICTADNGGRGFLAEDLAHPGSEGAIFLNVELAKSAWLRLEREAKQCAEGGYVLSDSYRELYERAHALMEAMQAERSKAKKALLADQALGAALLAGEKLVVERAEQRIARRRNRPMRLVVKDSKGRPIDAATLKYRQTEHDFRFGIFVNPHTHPLSRVPLETCPLWERLREMGINQLTVAILWPRVEPNRGEIRPENEYDLWPAHTLREAGFTLKSHVSVWFWHGGKYPDQWGAFVPMWAYSLTPEEIKRAVSGLMKALIAKYHPHLTGWQAINEAMLYHTNAFNLDLDQHVEIVGEVIRTLREHAPGAVIEVNNCQVFGEGINASVVEQGYERVPDDFYRALLDRGVEFDVVGMQLYYGGYMYSPFWRGAFPVRHPWDLEAIIERYSRLGKPINISEVSVPSTHPLPEWGIDLGYWHGPWDLERQAAWVELFYTLCYSIPQVREITWWNATDEGAFIRDGGLLFDDYTPKPAAKTLARLTSNWLARGEAAIRSGHATVCGPAGTYEIQVESDGKLIGTATVHLDPAVKGPIEVVLAQP